MKNVLSLKIPTDHIFSRTVLGGILHPIIFSFDQIYIFISSLLLALVVVVVVVLL